jgi:serine/threonine-protein kinase
MPLVPSEVFAGYTIVRMLGSGGMGEVYLAEHPRLPRQDALKILGTDVSANEEYRQRFVREADLAAKLWHPNIVRVNDRGEFDGQLWISMDYIEGTDAARQMQNRYPAGMPAGEVAEIVSAVASALDYAHQRGVLHRDVKPANILLATPEDDERRILLGDFGIARNVGDISGLTATNMTMGTLPYAAPEQLMDGPMDGRADQYALAATAYHLLTGSPLFPLSNPAAVISRHLNAPPPTLAGRHPELAALDPVLARALAKKPANRFARCTDFARAFAAALQPGVHAAAAAPTMQVPAGHSRPRWPIAVGAIAVILLIGAIVFVVRPWRHDRATDGTTATPTSATPSVTSSITFDGMRDFVTAYYRDLPAHPNDAWTKLDAHCQNQTGLRQYLDFWATIQSVTLVSVSPRDATSVIARLTYVRRDGHTDTEDRWFKMALVNGALLLDESQRNGAVPTAESTTTAPTLPSAGAVPASSIDTLLPTAAEISKLLGITVTNNTADSSGALKMDTSSYGTADHSAQVKPPSCVGVAFTAEHNVYGDTGFQAIKTQSFSTGYGSSEGAKGPESLEQTVAVFPSADLAQKFLTSSQTQWNTCANSEVDVVLGFENGRGFRLGSVQREGNVITVSMASNGALSGPHACQQALGARENVVVQARSCNGIEQSTATNYDPVRGWPTDPKWASDDAARLANAMLDKVRP